jgi:N-acetylneuraminate synthase
VWDKDSVDFMSEYIDIAKIPSALITDVELCKYARSKFDTLLISTGMSTEEEIEICVCNCKPDVIMHTNSTYPSPVNELNLNYIHHLKSKWPSAEIGYSGHEYGLVTTFAAVAIGASWVERHLTLDRTMWGSDHVASVEPQGMIKLVKGIRDIEKAIGESGPRKVANGELSKRKSLRK